MPSSRLALAICFGAAKVRGDADITHSKHDDWWYGASEGNCATVNDQYRCGPTDWYKVAGDESCKEVGTQSPIDIVMLNVKPGGADLKALNLTDGNVPAEADYVINGHTTEVDFGDTNTMKITWGGVDYFLKQLHFHSPSENKIEGEYYPMEVHHVHKDASGNALVLAVMIETGATDNAYYADIWSKIATVPAGSNSALKWEKAASFKSSPYTGVLPSDSDGSRSYFYYEGSFTTPPCTNGTKWVVLDKPISISNAQLQAYRTRIQTSPQNQLAKCDAARCGGEIPTGVADHIASGYTWNTTQGTNNRPIQDLTGPNNKDRVVTYYAGLDKGSSATVSLGRRDASGVAALVWMAVFAAMRGTA